MRSRVCIFCGKTPKSKNKEHVIPKWLYKATGGLTRKISLGHDWRSGIDRIWSANKFEFPSCEECNTVFAQLEYEAQAIVMRAINEHVICSNKVTTLLDWLDKIRVGVWLGLSYLNKESLPVTPSFYISDRVGVKDRVLHVYRLPTSAKHLSLTGVAFPLHVIFPSCFALLIHDTVFLNYSYDGLFAKNAGFPFAKNFERISIDRLEAIISEGTEELIWPLCESLPEVDFALSIYQVCQPQAIAAHTDWHILNSISERPGLSLPLVKSGRLILSEFERSLETTWDIPLLNQDPNLSWNATALLTNAIQRRLFKRHCESTNKDITDAEKILIALHDRFYNDLHKELTGSSF